VFEETNGPADLSVNFHLCHELFKMEDEGSSREDQGFWSRQRGFSRVALEKLDFGAEHDNISAFTQLVHWNSDISRN
jgi:hypothetical protein